MVIGKVKIFSINPIVALTSPITIAAISAVPNPFISNPGIIYETITRLNAIRNQLTINITLSEAHSNLVFKKMSVSAPSSRKLLTCEAVESSKSQDKINGVDTDYQAVREDFSENAKSGTVLRIIKCRNENGSI